MVTPADAAVMNPEEFRRVITYALHYTESNDAIVTIGIKPSRPETGYGYVELDESKDEGIFSVKEFKEKPDLATAKEYLASGKYLWNAGIFVWNVATIIECISTNKPNIAAAMEQIIETGDVDNIFPTCEKISIDYAVMEPESKRGRVCTCPADFGWSDLGNWASLHDKLQHDNDNNAIVGNVRMYDSRNCTVHVEDADLVVIQGLNGYIVSEKNGRILICRHSEEQRIKEWSVPQKGN